MPTFTPPPPAPQRGDRVTFSNRVDAFLTWLVAIIAQLNTFVAGLNARDAGGAYTFGFTFDAVTADSDPGPGKLRLGSTVQNNAIELRIDNAADSGIDIAAFLSGLQSGTSNTKGSVRLEKAKAPGTSLLFDILAITNKTGYSNLTVINRGGSSASPFVNGDALLAYFSRAGDKGDGGGTPSNQQIRDAIGVLPVTSGGTGANTADAALAALGGVSLSSLAAGLGALLIGFFQAGTTYLRSVLDKLRDNVNVRDFGALGDGSDQTAAIAKAAEYGIVRVPAGIYEIDRISLTKSVVFECEPGCVFRRKAGVDLPSGGYLTSTAMFEIATAGLTVRFLGSPTFDGNRSAQTAVEPSGYAIKITLPATPGADIELYIENAVFRNGTSTYLHLRGDDVRRRYRTNVTLVRCKFYDAAIGKGKGDPSTPTALGYSPTYVICMDRTRLVTYDFWATYDGALGLGQYGPCGILGTFAGGDFNQSGEAEVYMFGRTEILGLGRAGNKYNDANEWLTNNGIGCIDLYGNGAELFIEQITARNCRSPAVRAKGSIKRYTVQSAFLDNCFRGLQVSPSSTGPCEAVVTIGSVMAAGGTIPAVECTGSTAADTLRSVTIENANLYGTYTNPESLVNEGLIKIRNVAKLNIASAVAIGAPTSAITLEAIQRAHVRGLVTNSSGLHGVLATNCENLTLENYDIRNCGGSGVRITTDMAKLVLANGYVKSTVDYGVINQGVVQSGTFRDITVDTVTGLGRAFYVGTGSMTLTGCSAFNVTTPLFNATGALLREEFNSWNPRSVYGGFSTTTTGTWNVGDRVKNTAPIPGGNEGWVCTTAGTPGTFKTYGVVGS